nr:hypothetical protein [Tanacetum cinerariifolium]
MHNNIMVACSRDHPPMLANRRYAHWRSRFLRYIDTQPNDDALKKCILEGPYTLTTVVVPAVPETDDSLVVPEHIIVETLLNMTPENKAHYQSKKEVIHLILTRIGDEIYSTVLQNSSRNVGGYRKVTTRFYKLMNEMIENNLTVATMQVNVQILQQLQPEWSRFVTIVKQQHKLDEVSYHKLFDILKQYQKEVNELCAERIATNANPLALVATSQPNQDPYYQTSKYHKSYAPISKPSIPTKSHTTTRHKGFIDSLLTKNLLLVLAFLVASILVQLLENVGSPVVQQSGIQCFNCKEFGHFAKECRKPKSVKDFAYHKEKMFLCKQAEKGVPLQAEQSDWLAYTNEEIDEHELYNVFANELQHCEQFESINNTCVVETDDSNVIPDSPDMCDNDIQNNQNDVECDDEHVSLDNLIANLKLDVYGNKKIQKQLKKANTTLAQELKECKSILAETSRTLGESNSIRDTQKDIDIKEGLKLKAYEISVVKEKHDELVKQSLLTKSHYEGLVKAKTKTIQTIHMLAPKVPTYNGRPTFANPRCLKQAQSEIPCLYAFPYDQSAHANRLIPDREETLALERESRLKLNKDLVRQKHSLSLEMALQQCQEQMKNDTVCKEKASNVFQKEREQYFEIQDLKAQLHDKNIAINELKKLIEKMKGKSVDTKFEKPSILGKPPLQPIRNQPVVRQPTTYKSKRSQLPRHQFASLVGVSHNLKKPVTPHYWPRVRKSSFSKPYDVNAPGPSRKSPKHMSFQTPRESVGSNDMVHNYYLEEAKKKAQL